MSVLLLLWLVSGCIESAIPMGRGTHRSCLRCFCIDIYRAEAPAEPQGFFGSMLSTVSAAVGAVTSAVSRSPSPAPPSEGGGGKKKKKGKAKGKRSAAPSEAASKASKGGRKKKAAVEVVDLDSEAGPSKKRAKTGGAPPPRTVRTRAQRAAEK